MADDPPLPSLLWRAGSTVIMGLVGTLTRAFMHGPNWQDAHGLDGFLELLDKRADVDGRQRGLITVSNHICVIDDPLTWGILPLRYHFNPSNHRWSLGSYDIVFKNKAISTFFTLGQVLPTHRLHKDPHGGPFQPTLLEAIRLLSRPPFTPPPPRHSPPSPPNITDPFSSPTAPFTYTTNGTDTFPAPSAYATRQHAWIHIFPEGRVHQHPQKAMRYFKWGVARLILEPDECPDVVPMWIEGHDAIMHEGRAAPRWAPRVGKRCGVWFGGNVGGEESGEGNAFRELRERWRGLVEEDRGRRAEGGRELGVGELSEELKYGVEAVRLREECTMRVRGAVLKVRRERGLPDEDPKEGLVETWRAEGGKREGQMDDGSLVKDT